MVTYEGVDYSYRFRHEPDYEPKRKDRPRGVHGRTTCYITFRTRSQAESDSDNAVTRHIVLAEGVAYCSKKEEPLPKSSQLYSPRYGTTNQAYDVAYGRRQAFEKAIDQINMTALRRVLWVHFLTHVTQAVDVPAQPARRIYVRFALDELDPSTIAPKEQA